MSEVFQAKVSWLSEGLPFQYKSYSRQYLVQSAGKPDFIATAAPEYFGSRYHYNPEDLLVVSLSACHMLSYLALAANSKIEVLSYSDDAKGELHKDGKVIRFKDVVLRPKIKLAKGADVKKAEGLHHKAHEICFIANSVNFPVTVEPEFETA